MLLRVDPPFEESEFIKPIQYNGDTPISVGLEVSMFKWTGTGEDSTCKKMEVNGLPEQVIKTPIKISAYDPDVPINEEIRSPRMIMYSNQRDDNACWGDNKGNKNNMQAYLIAIF